MIKKLEKKELNLGCFKNAVWNFLYRLQEITHPRSKKEQKVYNPK
jgi:hypothetical protein